MSAITDLVSQIMQKADKMGRPWYGLVPTLLVGGGLAYLNVSYGKLYSPITSQLTQTKNLTPPS
jgi:amino acid permease